MKPEESEQTLLSPTKRKKGHCEHGRRKSRCKECGGSQICQHGRVKSVCKECKGSSICTHGRVKSACKECGGSQICLHGRLKLTCKQCRGSQICTHGKRKSVCKQCKGSSICTHGRIRLKCKECRGSQICTHGRDKTQCKECCGSQICMHGKRKTDCKECGGSQICTHGRNKLTCKECGGSQICTHGRIRSQCKECGGSRVCKHGKRKSNCKDCGGANTCVNDGCSNRTTKPGVQCRSCLPAKRQKVTEKRMEWHLNCWADQGKIPHYLSWDKRIDGINAAACNPVRPDFFFDFSIWVLVVENDEHAHARNEPRCDHIRIQDISNAFGQVPVYVIRFNPHTVRVNGMIQRITIDERMELLLLTMQDVISNPNFEHHITLKYLYYPCTQCTLERGCSFQHVDRFTTMLDYAAYINTNYPLDKIGAGQRCAPSQIADHYVPQRDRLRGPLDERGAVGDARARVVEGHHGVGGERRGAAGEGERLAWTDRSISTDRRTQFAKRK